MKTITKIIIEIDDDNNLFFNGQLVPPPYFDNINLDNSNIPNNCINCPNHPSNGGSGICHCILGQQQITY